MDINPVTTKTDPVAEAFAALKRALRAAALEEGADYNRTSAFMRTATQQEARWKAGEPTHTVRAPKGTSAG